MTQLFDDTTPKIKSQIDSKFNTLIHAPKRLQLCALLSAIAEVEFKRLREELDVSDSVLSKHVKQLEEVGYITVNKKTDFGRQRTWLSLSESGHKAYNGHVGALKAIVGSI